MSPVAPTAGQLAARHIALRRAIVIATYAILLAAIAWVAINQWQSRRAAEVATASAAEFLPIRQVPSATTEPPPVAVFGGHLTVDREGRIVLADATHMVAGESHRFLVPEEKLPLRLTVVGRFSVVKPDAVSPELGSYTGEILLSGKGKGIYKLFPVSAETGRWTGEPPLVITVTVVKGDGDIELLPSAEKES